MCACASKFFANEPARIMFRLLRVGEVMVACVLACEAGSERRQVCGLWVEAKVPAGEARSWSGGPVTLVVITITCGNEDTVHLGC